ncbi:hypothetical protein A0Z28_08000 [Campylobacter lari]|nr:hypothetical protein [Campylobacter lari]
MEAMPFILQFKYCQPKGTIFLVSRTANPESQMAKVDENGNATFYFNGILFDEVKGATFTLHYQYDKSRKETLVYGYTDPIHILGH